MKKQSYWIGLALSVIFLILFFRKTDLGAMWAIFASVDYRYTLLLMAINILTLWIRAVRWGYLLRPIKKVPLNELYKATAIGFMANNLLPARIGEIVRAYLLGSRARISRTASLATIVVERLFDGFTILFLFFMVLLFMPFPPQDRSRMITPETLKTIGFLSLFFYGLVLTILLLLRFQNDQARRLIGFFLERLPQRLARPVREKIHSFVSGLEVLKKDKDLLIIILYSFLLWGVLSLSIYLLYLGFHLKLSLLSAFFVETILVFGVSIPSAPGFIGTYHWACAAGLLFLGVEPNLAKSFAMVLWLTNFIPMTGMGLLVLWKEGLSLRGLQRTRE